MACRLQFPVVTSPVPRGAISGWPSWTACQNVQVRNTVWAQEAEMHRTERVLARCCFCCGGSSHCFICMAASVGAYIQRVAMILATHMYIFNFFIRRLSLISSLFFCCIFFLRYYVITNITTCYILVQKSVSSTSINNLDFSCTVFLSLDFTRNKYLQITGVFP